MIPENKLDFWISKNYNVLFVGKHGVGKTACIKEAFERNGLRWKYFSASTLDPWVDLCGVPSKTKGSDGVEYLELIRPKEFANDEVEALFFDEYNRSHKKVRNAVMELIQFKSINGKKFNNLKIVWAAINPDGEDEEYDVEKLDKAQEDRFHVKVDVPYIPYPKYFTDKYGKEYSEAAISWWKELPEEIKNEVSPRRLDYALDMHINEGDLRDVLPAKCNISKLLLTLKSGPIKKQLNIAAKNEEEAKKFISSENNYAAAISYIIKDDNYLKVFLHHISEEKISSLLAANKNVLEFVAKNASTPIFGKVVLNIINANQSKKLVKELKKLLPAQARTTLTGASYSTTLKNLQNSLDGNTQQRSKIFEIIEEDLPSALTSEEAIETLNILANKVVARTQEETIRRYFKGLGKILTQCLTTLAIKDSLNSADEVILKYNPTWNIFNQKVSRVKLQKPDLTLKV